MLPVNLKKLKETLEVKGYAKRTRGEDAILEELVALDGTAKMREAMNENTKLQTNAAVFDGPSGTCPCCGRAV